MTSRFIQAPGTVFMIRPHRFHPNPETAIDNAFQRAPLKRTVKEVAKDAYDEVTNAAKKLED